MKEEGESGVLIDIGHPSPMLPGETIVKGLEKSVDLIFICFSTWKDYDCLTEVEGRAGCRFIFY